MPQARKSARSTSRTSATYKEPAALKRLNSSLDSAQKALTARGAVFETDTFVNNDAFRTAFFNDPEGNRCQIVWRARPLGQ